MLRRLALAPTVVLALAAGVGCPSGGGNTIILPERGPGSFPGIRVPRHEGPLPVPAAEGPVWIIGYDGMTWDVARPLLDAGELPALRRFVDEGAHGVLLSEEPTISPAIWATISTGMPRHVHGVLNFLEKDPGKPPGTPAGPLHRRSPALWDLVGAAGGQSLVVAWFGSYPAESIRGRYVSKFFDPANPMAGGVQPPELAELLAREARPDVRDDEWEAIAKTAFLRSTLQSDALDLANLLALLPQGRNDLVAFHLAGLDVAQHVTWRNFDPGHDPTPETAPPDPALAGVIPAYYRFADRQLGRMLDAAPANATIFLVSDHGGGPIRLDQAIHLQFDVLLREMGLFDGSRGELLSLSAPYRNVKRAWLNVAGTERDGVVPPGDALARSAAIERRFKAVTTDAGEPAFASVENLVREPGWQPGDVAFVLLFSDAVLTAGSLRDGDRVIDLAKIRMRHGDVSGGHRLEGVIAVRGPHVRKGELPPVSIYNIAPSALHALGLPQDARMLAHAPEGGGVAPALFDEAWLASHPVRAVSEYPGTDRAALLREAERPVGPHEEEDLERLRTLGYVR